MYHNVATEGPNIHNSGLLSITSSHIRAGMQLAAGSTTTYVLPAPPGHWVPAARCEVWREACPANEMALGIRCMPASCSTDTTDNVNACSNSAFEGPCWRPATINQPCDWRTSPDLIDETVYVLPLGTHNLDFPFVCAPGIRRGNGTNPSEQTSATCAGLCPAGFTCGGGQEGVEPVACPEAHYCPEGSSVALPCPAGSYGAASGLQAEQECTVCPAGTYCFAGSTAATSCSKGTYAANESSQLCEACPEGKYQGDEGASACNVCADGYTCPEGSFVRLIPESCDPGTYRNATLELCLNCTAGSMCAGGASEPRPCARGSYCVANVHQPTDCPAGRYGSVPGLSNASCSGECAQGYYCKANSVSAKAAACTAGTYGNATGLVVQANCTTCPVGHDCREGAAAPSLCNPGAFANTTGLGECVPCAAGTFSSTPGATACDLCEPGGFCPSVGAASASMTFEQCSGAFTRYRVHTVTTTINTR